jgi:hypothetical protein
MLNPDAIDEGFSAVKNDLLIGWVFSCYATTKMLPVAPILNRLNSEAKSIIEEKFCQASAFTQTLNEEYSDA